MANTTGTLSGDLEAKYAPEREIWQRVPLYARLSFALFGAALSLGAIAICIFVAWEAAMWVFKSPDIQSLATGPAIASWPMVFWLQWALPACVGLGTLCFCVLKARIALDSVYTRIQSWLSRRVW
jgi:hypothetical protein